MDISAIIVAAGRGTRMGGATAKAFLPLAGQPMLLYSLRTLSGVSGLRSMVVVAAPAQVATARQLVADHGPWAVVIHVAAGGVERQDSVAAGFAMVDSGVDLVIVHDAARPFVSSACVHACVAAAASGAAIVALPARDTVKVVDAERKILQTLDRTTLWLAQTPQVFRASWLREAYERARRDGYVGTDDAALVERTGRTVRVVPGEETNRKITTPEDLRWAEWYLQSQAAAGSR